MIVEEGDVEEEGEGKNILVGIQLDRNGRELLNWALGKFAGPGDRVFAVHVCRKSDLCDTSTLAIIKVLGEYLAEYEGLCNSKKVVLVGRISPGSSIKKVLVKEAENCAAVTVIVGRNNNYSLRSEMSFRGSASLAKYCAKKLPPTMALLAVDNGKVIFEREATKLPQGESPKLNLRSLLHPSLGMDPKIIIPHIKPELAGLLREDTEKKAENVDVDDVNRKLMGLNSSLQSLPVISFQEAQPGWPLLRTTALVISDSSRYNEARNMSVVQWVMNLPNRSLASSPQLGSENPKTYFGQDDPSTSSNLAKELEIILQTKSSGCRWFTHFELRNSTSQFSSENLIGKGGSSQVYKGCLLNGQQQVAVKKTKLSNDNSSDLLLEVDIITTLQHENIVPLMGVSVENNDLLLVYRFLSKGSLAENLNGTIAKPPLTWDVRYKVALGVAEALNYLHNGCSRPVIHRDVKSSNILLSDDFEPQLTDFGLALWAPTTSSDVTHSDVVGTFGYLAPEYFMYGKVSEKIDVYSFGVVLLELLTGRKPISTENSKGQESLVMWATLMLGRGDVKDIVDPTIEGKYEENQMRIMALTASLCIRRTARLRPSMIQVLKLLQGKDVEVLMASNVNNGVEELDNQDDEAYPQSSVASHLGLALLDVDDTASASSIEQSYQKSLEEYLRERCSSRSSSFH